MLVKNLSELTPAETQRILERGQMPEVQEAVLSILQDVQARGDEAVKNYTKKFDNVDVGELRVGEEEMRNACSSIDPLLLKHLQRAALNIQRFHERQKTESWMEEISEGIILGQRITPLQRVGVYVPGGRAAYPSTALMCIIPARVAGVEEVIVCTPPGADGSIHPLTLAACYLSGADQVFRVGGVQAIAAMAYGTETIPGVDKIVGPGNVYVTAAKTLVRSHCEIDFPAGPSEILIIADGSASPANIAWDLLAQCEHDPGATAILTTTSSGLAEKVVEIIKSEAEHCRRGDIINQSLQNTAVLTASSLAECIEFSNSFAPEHLEIITENPEEVLAQIRNAGSIFIGNYTPVSAGDYASGTNHVLPTAGYARIYSGLNLDHFLRKMSVQMLDKKGLGALRNTIISVAEAEGLYAHAEAVRVRFRKT